MNKLLVLAFVAVLAFAGCSKRGTSSNTNSTEKIDQVEKIKPAPGTGNVQGRVLYNSKPVEN